MTATEFPMDVHARADSDTVAVGWVYEDSEEARRFRYEVWRDHWYLARWRFL